MFHSPLSRIASSLLLLSLAVACNGTSNDSGDAGGDIITPTPPVVLATGWNSVAMIANSAKTTLDTVAHFDTSRNACGKEASGALDINLWNRITTDLNQISVSPIITVRHETCVDYPDGNRMDGTVDLVSDSGKRPLFEIRGGQVCYMIKDGTLAMDLLSAINGFIAIADKEDCPNGWGH